MVARDSQYVVIAPTDHCKFELAGWRTVIGEREFENA